MKRPEQLRAAAIAESLKATGYRAVIALQNIETGAWGTAWTEGIAVRGLVQIAVAGIDQQIAAAAARELANAVAAAATDAVIADKDEGSSP